MERRKGKDVAEMVSRWINTFTPDSDEFVKVLAVQHRSLQQSFFREVVWPLILHHDECYRNGYYDMRNEITCELCSKIVAAVGNEQLFPFI